MDNFSYKGPAAILACLVLAALVAAGCGGGSDSSSSSASGDNGGSASTSSNASASSDGSMTKAEFIKQGDAICEKGEKKFPKEIEAFTKQHNITGRFSKAQEEEAALTVLIPSLQVQADQLAQLEVPSGEEEEAEAIVGGFEDALVQAKKDPLGIVEASAPMAKVADLARAYGFEACLTHF